MKKFLKNNQIFVLLLLLILCIAVALAIYTYQKKMPVEPAENEVPVHVGDVPEDDKTAEITSLTGHYDRKKNQIQVEWKYNLHASKLESVKLYVNDINIGNVTNVSYYNLPQSVYGFPTDYNTIKLVLYLEGGMTIEKETKVFVDYIITAKQEVSQSEQSTKVLLQYVYDKRHPVEIPKILLTSGEVDLSSEVVYVGTETIENNNQVTARTTYEFFWSDNPVIYQTFGVRWIFAVEQDNFDFQATKGTK